MEALSAIVRMSDVVFRNVRRRRASASRPPSAKLERYHEFSARLVDEMLRAGRSPTIEDELLGEMVRLGESFGDDELEDLSRETVAWVRGVPVTRCTRFVAQPSCAEDGHGRDGV